MATVDHVLDGRGDDAPPAEDPEDAWLATTYRGRDVPQLTLRAVLLGGALGAVMGLSNLYVGLKTGWSLGVVLTASLLGWGTWRALRRMRLATEPLSILELNAMASLASAAGYSTGVNLVSAVAAYAMITGAHLPLGTVLAWTASVAGLGLAFAILVKRRLVNVEALPFPTGRAAAETLRALTSDKREASAQVRVLAFGVAAGIAIVVLGDGLRLIASLGDAEWLEVLEYLALPPSVPGPMLQGAIPFLGAIAAYGFTLETSGLFVAAGVITGPRIAFSVLVGAVLGWGVLAPVLVHQGVVGGPDYREGLAFLVWVGVPMMIAAALVHVARMGGALQNAARSVARRSDSRPIDAVEIPRRWFWVALAVAGVPCVVLQVVAFAIPVPLAVLAVAIAGALTIVAARVTGETDVTPTGPLGKITQLVYGGLTPGAPIPNLMATGVSAGAATSAADLLTDLKSGWLLGADPRQQFWAQTIGVLVGTAVVVPAFVLLLVPDPSVLGSTAWPAPAAQVWRSVAELFGGGAGLPAGAPIAIAIAAALGLLLAILEQSPRMRRFVPSPTAVGLGIVMPASNGLGFAVGGLFALWLVRRRPLLVAAAAGVIAGQSVLGLLVTAASS